MGQAGVGTCEVVADMAGPVFSWVGMTAYLSDGMRNGAGQEREKAGGGGSRGGASAGRWRTRSDGPWQRA
ncbi:hypothetical protein SGLAM104S_10453 [Streptomyces glaucescens]